MAYPIPEKNDLTEILCLTTYPPKECGIATYSQDLHNALKKTFGDSFQFTIYPLVSEKSNPVYPKEIQNVLNTDYALDFLQAAHYINSNKKIGLVLIEHEFGLFHNNEQSFYEFIGYLEKPVVVTFHTVLPGPSPELRSKVNTIASFSAGIIVMTRTSADILIREYGISPEKITVIAHGTHLIEYNNRNILKIEYGLKGRTVLSTFGLLGPGKSIETTLDALPGIIKKYPKVIFLIIGKTHPTLIKEEGGDLYREFLKQKVDTLNLGDHVRFIDQFVPLNNLLEYLQLTDIYLFTSKDPNQAVSGTFAYALSCGCPIISTPIPHAVEVLKNGAGTVFDFQDPRQLQRKVLNLLDNTVKRNKMRLNGLHTASVSAWENVAIAHIRVFEKILENAIPLKYQKPPINLKHLKKMTTQMGIIQFSTVNEPDIESGYTLDDNARALIAFCQHFKLTADPSDIKYIYRYFNFIVRCFRHDGTFLNCVDKECRFTDENTLINLEDARGRAIWALGYFLSISGLLPIKDDSTLENAKFIFEQAIQAMKDANSPRAIAFLIKGLYFYNRFDDRECLNTVIRTHADKLVHFYKDVSTEDWRWYEDSLTYGNSVIPHAMLMAYIMTLDTSYGKIAKESFDFLLSKIFHKGAIRVICNKNWHHRDETLEPDFKGGEQPIDVAYTILALHLFDKIYPLSGYASLMKNAFEWFLGNNPLDQTIYNPCTGGCYDGLELHNVNLNQGAESTISYLLARMAMEDMDA
ncbi:MAG TPA: glycosyltransferase [Arenibacter sp.]|nr:glycosyltransferase [Arenibacter sp.]